MFNVNFLFAEEEVDLKAALLLDLKSPLCIINAAIKGNKNLKCYTLSTFYNFIYFHPKNKTDENGNGMQ